MSPLWVPAKGVLKFQQDNGGGNGGGGGGGVVVQTGASATVKGTAVALFDPTLFDAYWLTIEVFGLALAVTASEGCMDVLVGPAGGTADEVLIPNLLIGYAGSLGTGSGFRRYDFPLYIPANTKVMVQAASVRLSTNFTVRAQIMGGTGGPFWPYFTKCTTVGMGTLPNGTAVVPGASNAAGTPTQIIASTAEDYGCLVPGFQLSADTTTQDRHLSVDVMVGGAGVEQMIGGTWTWATYVNEAMHGPILGFPIYDDIPAGTRLSLRASNTSTNDGAYNGVIHCLS